LNNNKIHIDTFFKDKIKNQDPVSSIPDFNDLFSNGIPTGSNSNSSEDLLSNTVSKSSQKVYSLSTLSITAGITLFIGFILGFYIAGEINKENHILPATEEHKAIINLKKETNSVLKNIKEEIDNNTESEIITNETSISNPIEKNKINSPNSINSIPISKNHANGNKNDSHIGALPDNTNKSKTDIFSENKKASEIENTPINKNNSETETSTEKNETSVNEKDFETEITSEKKKENIILEKEVTQERENSEDSEEGIDLFIK